MLFVTDSMIECVSFAPIASAEARILVLGTMPGRDSLRTKEYYAHPRNVFWRIMGELVGARPNLPYAERLQALTAVHIALWDVLKFCMRSSSLDAHIRDEIPNDFEQFMAEHPHIKHVFFNGKKAEQVFRRYVLPDLQHRNLTLTLLPSTSPAHAAACYAEKLNAWCAIAGM